MLGFTVHSELIEDVVTDEKMLPVTVGLYGDWGGGKTSVLNLLKAELQSEKSEAEGIACLYFNGWIFEGYDDAKAALLSTVLVTLGEHKRFGPKIKDSVVSLLKSVNWTRVASLGIKNVALPAIAAYATGGRVDQCLSNLG